MTKEEFVELYGDDYLEVVKEDIDDSWRHGNRYQTVFEQVDDDGNGLGIFWYASYQISGDGEYNGIYDNNFNFHRVYPHTRTVVETYYDEKPE